MRQKENDMQDTIKPAGIPGFVLVTLRNGYERLLAVETVREVSPRLEGGCTIRSHEGDTERPLLLDLPVKTVLRVLQHATKGGDHATT